MNNKQKNKLLSILMVMVMTFAMLPVKVQAQDMVQIGGPETEIVPDVSGNDTAIYFGKNGDEPIRWRVMANENGILTLMSNSAVAFRKYNTINNHANWSGSDICHWLNGTGSYGDNGFLPTAFSQAERSLMQPQYSTTAEERYYITITPNQTIVLPSISEVMDGTWGMSKDDRKLAPKDPNDPNDPNPMWWLRTPSGTSGPPQYYEFAGLIDEAGDFIGRGYAWSKVDSYNQGIRPTFKLDPSSAFLISSVSGKSGAVGSLRAIEEPTGDLTLTLLGNDLPLFDIDSQAVKAVPGDTISRDYGVFGRGSGERYVSGLIVDDDNKIEYYGRLHSLEYSTPAHSDEVNITIPEDIPDGSYTIKLFYEQTAGDYYTDYITQPIEIPLTINTVPAVINPTTASFEKYSSDHVETEITWNTANVVTDVKSEGSSIGADNFTVTENTLKIHKEYLTLQPNGSLQLTIAFDNGDPATLSIEICEPAAISPISASFDKYKPMDVETEITWNTANDVVDVKSGDSSIEAENYTVSDDTLKIHQGYLHTLPAGTLVLTIEFNTGAPATLTIEILDTTGQPPGINPTSVTYDLANPSDVNATIFWREASSVDGVHIFVNGNYTESSTYHTIIEDIFTIKKEFLSGFSPSTVLRFAIVFDPKDVDGLPLFYGNVWVNIVDSTPPQPSISPTVVSYDLANPTDVNTIITWSGAETVTGVVYGGVGLQQDLDYTVSGDTLTIRDDYLSTLNLSEGDTLAFDISFNAGNPVTLMVNAVDSYIPSSNAALSNLTVGGVTVTGFVYNTYEYDVLLPYGSQPGSPAATIGAITDDPKALVSITQASQLPGTATILVTAEDMVERNTYTVNFTLEGPPATTINIGEITGVSIPQTGEIPVSSISETDQYTGTVVWKPEDNPFNGNTVYKATITLTAKEGYTLNGVSGNFFTIEGAALVTNNTNSGIITAIFPATASSSSEVTHTVIFLSDGEIYTTATVQDDTAIGDGNWPANPMRSGYTFEGWYTGINGTGTRFTSSTVVKENIVVYGNWTQSSSGGGGVGGGGGGGGSIPSLNMNVGTTSVGYTQRDGNVTLSLTDAKVAQIIRNSDTTAVVDVSNISEAKTVILPATALETLGKAGLSVKFNLPAGNLSISPEALVSIAAQATGTNVTILLDTVDSRSLTSQQREAAGSNTVYDISIISGRQNISSFNGSLTVTLPYTLASGDSPEGVSVWYLNDAGNLTEISCQYSKETGTVSFVLDHLSYYVVGYQKLLQESTNGITSWVNPFSDVKESDWFYNNVAFAVENRLFSGTSADTFSPSMPMTRAMLVTVLHRMSESIDIEGQNPFSDVPDNVWYTNAVTWASAKGIISCYSDDRFGPNDPVTRQQMATILRKYGESFGYDISASGNLVQFIDGGDVSPWATEAMSWAVGSRLISGKGGGILDPQGQATRAEVATILKKFIKNR
ncbi:Listeria/Bacterioides repeat-containing protein [Natronincola peptidivorans]|uniref:Listeria/Bacterioides repeat-containing protein n=1 Tax=Natronincola peptidivorans TaxID=426128 RepID=A0A1I0DS53_9FIRM|nr:X2-like carbohydrate binding domain-containing protein [Natronincola peptidivorans]SET34774.1 Listeria/Bacterioides repeat-containing protein [Natronincola peptidivorans]